MFNRGDDKKTVDRSPKQNDEKRNRMGSFGGLSTLTLRKGLRSL